MNRAYSLRLIALTTGVDGRWLDNLLSRHQIPGVSRQRRGVERRINDEALLAIELVRVLNLELGVSMATAVAVAAHMLAPQSAGMYRTTSGLTLTLSIAELRQRLRARLLESLEFVARIPRGRPRSRPDEID